MAFNPLFLLILKSRGRSVAVFRDRCADYDVSRPQSLFLDGLSSDRQQSVIAVSERYSPTKGDAFLNGIHHVKREMDDATDDLALDLAVFFLVFHT
jgi:hypothetical protein